MESDVFDFMWLLLTGVLVGLLTRKMMRGKAYGTVADMLLGITGAFAFRWLIENLASSSALWSNEDRLVFTMWGAAGLPALAHFLSERQTSVRRAFNKSKPVNEILPRPERKHRYARPI